MEISHRAAGVDTVVVTIAGRVMMGHESEQITTLVSELLSAGNRVIVFDLSAVTKIDSTGIGRFIASYNQIAAGGGEMRMAKAGTFVLQAFHVCRLDTVFRFYASVDEACKAQ